MYCALYQSCDSHKHIKPEQLRSAIKCHSVSAGVPRWVEMRQRSRTRPRCYRRSVFWSYDPKSQSRGQTENVQLPWLRRDSPHHTRSLAPLLERNWPHMSELMCCGAVCSTERNLPPNSPVTLLCSTKGGAWTWQQVKRDKQQVPWEHKGLNNFHWIERGAILVFGSCLFSFCNCKWPAVIELQRIRSCCWTQSAGAVSQLHRAVHRFVQTSVNLQSGRRSLNRRISCGCCEHAVVVIVR